MRKDIVQHQIDLRKNAQVISAPFIPYISGGTIQMTFRSAGCANAMSGSCIFCNYGAGYQITLPEVNLAMEYIKNNLNPECPQNILLGTFGSFLDEREIPEGIRDYILEETAKLSANKIIIETHYTTVTEQKLDKIRTILKNKKIDIEMGLESVNKRVQSECLNKTIDLPGLKKVVDLIKSYDMNVTLNIMYGIPFLSKEERRRDFLESVRWAVENGGDEIVVFPMNVRPNTILREVYERGEYELVSKAELDSALLQLSEDQRDKIFIAWTDIDRIRSQGAIPPLGFEV